MARQKANLESAAEATQKVEVKISAERQEQNKEFVFCLSAKTEKGLHAQCETLLKHLDTHEVPDRVVFMESLPRSFIGKVLKRDLVAGLQ